MNVKPIHFKDCRSSAPGKFAKLSVTPTTTLIDAPFHLIHCDLWESSPILSTLGYKYFALFINQCTRFTWIYFLRDKSKLANIVKIFIIMIVT